MLERLGRFVVRRRKSVLAATVAVIILAGAFGGNVVRYLSAGGFEDHGAESYQARRLLEESFGGATPNIVLLVTAEAGGVDDPAVAAAGADLTRELGAEADVTRAVSYWSLGSPPPLRSTEGRQALVLATIGGSDDEVADRIETLSPRYSRPDGDGPITVRVGGFAEVFRQVSETIEKDLARAETITLPITLLLLVLVFGSVVAASLPLGVGVVAVVGTFLVLRVLASMTEVSIFSLNLTTAMGLGLAIDYSLFVVSRFREELRAGRSVEDAVPRTVATAGRTVIFSAVTVAVSLAALLLFPLAFLRSFAYAGTAVVAVAALGSVVALPALLAVLGHRVDKWSLRRRPAWPERSGRTPKPVGERFWHRIAMAVMQRPVLIGGAVVALLFVLAAPFARINFGLADDRVLPEATSSRQVQDEIRSNFTSQEAATVDVVAAGTGDPRGLTAQIEPFAMALSRLRGAARVDALTGSYIGGQLVAPPNPASDRFVATAGDGTWLSVVPSVEPLSGAAESLVKAVREIPAPFPVKVGGPSADLVDSKASLFSRMPLAAALIAVVTFVALFLFTGGVLVPLKAIVVNLLSLTATFGAMVWVFQDGHLSGLLDFTATGSIDTTLPILMFCIAFGLSMDYEVFLLSRIKEEYDRTGDNVQAVAVGLERTGGIVTAAAALLAVIFLAFATSGVTIIKMLGLGLALAVVVDATLVRAVLVPAFMRLAGKANWWAPAPLRRLHRRFGLSESPSQDVDVAAGTSTAAVGPDGGLVTSGDRS